MRLGGAGRRNTITPNKIGLYSGVSDATDETSGVKSLAGAGVGAQLSTEQERQAVILTQLGNEGQVVLGGEGKTARGGGSCKVDTF